MSDKLDSFRQLGKEIARSKRAAVRIEGTVEEVESMITTVYEIKDTVDKLDDQMTVLLPSIVSKLRFLTENDRITLTQFPYDCFPEFVWIQDRDYDRGEVIRFNNYKYLLLDGGRIDEGQTPATSNRCLLHRDIASYDIDGTIRKWVREEFCLQDFWRWWDADSNKPQQHGWYRVKVRLVNDATDPPNATDRWEFMGSEIDPPDHE